MLSQNLSTAVDILASTSFLAIMVSLVYLLIVIFVNYILARSGMSVKNAGYILVGPAAMVMILTAGSWGIMILPLVLAWTFFRGWKYRLPYQKLFIVNTAVIFMFTGLTLLMPFIVLDLDWAKMMTLIEKGLAKHSAELNKWGIKTATDMTLLKKQIQISLSVVQVIYPFLLFFYSTIVAVFLMPIIQFFWKRYQGAVVQKSTLIHFKLPDRWIFVLLGFLALAVWNMNWYNVAGSFIAWNGLLITAFFYAMQGSAVFVFIVQKKQKEKWLLPIALIFFFLLGSYAIVLTFLLFSVLGISDFWLNHRKLMEKNKGDLS